MYPRPAPAPGPVRGTSSRKSLEPGRHSETNAHPPFHEQHVLVRSREDARRVDAEPCANPTTDGHVDTSAHAGREFRLVCEGTADDVGVEEEGDDSDLCGRIGAQARRQLNQGSPRRVGVQGDEVCQLLGGARAGVAPQSES